MVNIVNKVAVASCSENHLANAQSPPNRLTLNPSGHPYGLESTL